MKKNPTWIIPPRKKVGVQRIVFFLIHGLSCLIHFVLQKNIYSSNFSGVFEKTLKMRENSEKQQGADPIPGEGIPCVPPIKVSPNLVAKNGIVILFGLYPWLGFLSWIPPSWPWIPVSWLIINPQEIEMRKGEWQWMRPCQLPSFSRESSVNKNYPTEKKIPFLLTINNHITNAIMSYL